MEHKEYKPIRKKNTPACTGFSTFFNLPNVKTTEDIDFAIAGVPFDTNVTFRPGTRNGPDAIRGFCIERTKATKILSAEEKELEEQIKRKYRKGIEGIGGKAATKSFIYFGG